jgi:hypothetical protein
MFSVVLHVAVNWPNTFLFGVICQMKKRTATCSQHTQCTAEPIRDQTTIDYTSDEASLSIIFKQLLVHGNTRYLTHVHFTQMLWQLQQRHHETWNLTPKALVNAGRPQALCTPSDVVVTATAIEWERCTSCCDIASDIGLWHGHRIALLRSTASISFQAIDLSGCSFTNAYAVNRLWIIF